jgi:hypothetical protein
VEETVSGEDISAPFQELTMLPILRVTVSHSLRFGTSIDERVDEVASLINWELSAVGVRTA